LIRSRTSAPDVFDPIQFRARLPLTEELLRDKKKFTALLAFDDITALGAIRALAKAGIRVPEDCSVIGFDDVALPGFPRPLSPRCASRSKRWATLL